MKLFLESKYMDNPNTLTLKSQDVPSLTLSRKEVILILNELDKVVQFAHRHGHQDVLDKLKERLMIDPSEGLFSLEGI